ncbi:haloacid dehalogenase type II [Paraburkholderia sp. J12]|uniref:haloacid dehalogenase type II n=1 Tax=Paraburkholderia sp. J12 TaxID=2805432 RepID=UPI002ABE0EFF|nr:haloacid dehalogenase type II [Paraburkholderia sp. J12]
MDKWITFDCYGTLVDWRAGMRASLEIVSPGNGERLLALHRKVEGEIEINEAYRPYREVLAESVRRMAAELGLALAGGNEEILSATMPFWPLYADTNAALLRLKELGYRLAILSNVDRDLISRTLRHFDVLFDLVVTAQDVRSYKPADAHARFFLERSGVQPGNWVYAAVNNQYDLVAGNRLGAQCIWINRDAERAADTGFLAAELSGMRELPDTLVRLASARR